MKVDAAQIVSVLLIGLVAGWLASFIVGGGSLVKYIIWGVIGSVVGGVVLPALGIEIKLGHPLANQIAIGTIGAVILVLVARFIA